MLLSQHSTLFQHLPTSDQYRLAHRAPNSNKRNMWFVYLAIRYHLGGGGSLAQNYTNVNGSNTRSGRGLSVSLLHHVSEGNHQIFKPNFESLTPKMSISLFGLQFSLATRVYNFNSSFQFTSSRSNGAQAIPSYSTSTLFKSLS